MQGLLTQIPTKATATKAGKVENSPLNALQGNETENKGDFSSLFANMVGTKEEGQKSTEGNSGKKGENTLDVLLSAKGQDQNKKTEINPLKPEVALSPEVLQNINNLLVKTPQVEKNTSAPETQLSAESAVSKKIAGTSSNLDQLLNSLKGTEDIAVEGEEQNTESAPFGNQLEKRQNLNGLKSESPLEFLLKESKKPNVGMESSPLLKSESSEKLPVGLQSKLGLSGEEFMKNSQALQSASAEKAGAGETFNPQQLLQKNMSQNMKAYGQKQNLLNSNVIKNTKDLAFKESKPKSAIDELKTPDLQIGADLSSIKESFIPVIQKQDSGQNLQADTQTKVLDLSRLNTSDSSEIIKRISDYIEQSQVASKDSLDLTVKHESLGQFNIQVNRSHGTANQTMDMQITTNTAEGHDFFMKNEISLMKNLSQAGIQLSDLKIVSAGSESMGFSQNDNRQSGNNQYQSDNSPREFMSFDSGDSSNGSQRRRALWEQAQQNQQRFGA